MTITSGKGRQASCAALCRRKRITMDRAIAVIASPVFDTFNEYFYPTRAVEDAPVYT
jgi:hypothetical protein